MLYELLRDTEATAEKLLKLRELMPRCNVSALVAGHPRLMLGMTVSDREPHTYAVAGMEGAGCFTAAADQQAALCL